jgi:hypothetical protein
MDVDPMPPDNDSPSDPGERMLNNLVAITIALLASFMAVCKVKDDNIVQAMQQAQADRNDHWSYYQAHNIRLEIARSTLVQLRLNASLAPGAKSAGYDGAIARYDSLVKDQSAKKDSVRRMAVSDSVSYDQLNYRDDQFDLSDAFLALAISLLAVTALTRRRWLYWVALVPTGFGAVMGLAGLLGWHVHPTMLTKLLS